MEISPAVQPPKSGDPITAKWASDLAAAVSSCANPAEAVGSVSSPFGKASLPPGLPMLGERAEPMPFDVCVYNDAGTDKVYCFLPPELSSSWGALVFANQDPAPRSSSQTGGTESNPWVAVGTVSSPGLGVLVLAFEDAPSDPDYKLKWRLHYHASWSGTDLYPSWASWLAPLVVIAQIPRGSGYGSSCMTRPGVRQFHRGFVCVGGSSWSLGGDEAHAYGKAVGNSSKAKVLDLDNRQLVGGWESTGDFTVANGTAKFFYGGNQYHPVNITDGNGNTYTVLAKV